MKTIIITLIIGALISAAIFLPEKVVIASGMIVGAGCMAILVGGMLAGHGDLNR